LAKQRLPAPLFHYIDGGADDEVTLRRNTEAFGEVDLVPNVLAGVGTVDLGTRVLGQQLDLPFFFSPTAMQRLFHHEGERAIAQTAERFGTMFGVSTIGTRSIEELGSLVTAPKLFQIYVHNDEAITRDLIDRCKAANFNALALTVDTIVAGNRERDYLTGMTTPPQLTLRSLASFVTHPRWSLNYLFRETFDLPNVSPYLAAGVLSPRQCLAAALEVNNNRVDSGHAGVVCWIEELIWREFYQHVLVGFPRVSKGRAFRPEIDRVDWSHDEHAFQRWTSGQTGYPIVDAAMRQLALTGWMHNRLRMIVAMFLTKDLMIDWRWGERHFMNLLVDGDLGSNNGGWQWSASTGTDAQPYFRIFNPTTQGQKFDKNGEFIRKFCPELGSLSGKALHEPLTAGLFGQLGYPEPMVDHKEARARALKVFETAAKD